MKATAIALLAALLPLQAQATELILNCQYEIAFDLVKDRGEPGSGMPRSGSFSAIVRMQSDGWATIDVSAGDCRHFRGSFSELKLAVGCLDQDTPSTLDIDRTDGAFTLVETREHATTQPIMEYQGHCKPTNKLF